MLIGVLFIIVGGWIAMQSTSSRVAFPLLIGGVVLVLARW
jgi:hypothetical protein